MCEIRRKSAVFIDADVGLLRASATPSGVGFAPYVPELLRRLHLRLGGALALISSREIAVLDALFTPHLFPAAGLHACELRLSDVVVNATPFSMDALSALHDECLRFASGATDIFVERRRCSVAINYVAPATEMHVWEFLHGMLVNFGDCFSLRRGGGYYEIIPSGYAKARAILEFMHSAPFGARLPIFIGGDTTSETAFEAVNYLGGATIRIGQGGYTCAKQSVPTPLAAHRLLAGLIDDFDWLIEQLHRPVVRAKSAVMAACS
jgi:trehalose 6-phosphate phosphatase